MIKYIEFENFRNLNKKYDFSDKLNVIVGKNNTGKSNLLDGIKLAFSLVNNDYFKISKSDFNNSDDSKNIIIKVELDKNSIPTLNHFDENGNEICGFKVTIKKTQSGRYIKQINYLNGGFIDLEILREDNKIPNVYTIPLIRIEDIYSEGLTVGLSKFIDSEENYKQIISNSKISIKKELESKTEKFKNFCDKFGQSLSFELTDPKISNEKLYIVSDSGDKEHNLKIGSGYKSIANIILNTLDENFNIILIDELENHLHPSLIRTLVRELRKVENTQIISTTHSPVIINELEINEILDISGLRLSGISTTNLEKLKKFLHPGRSELILSDNVILVEGYTEELLLKNYLKHNNNNWTIVNVAGVMFEPYIELSKLLNKHLVVISDNDKSLNEDNNKSDRFIKLEALCDSKNIKLLEMDNTLESDLYNNGYLNNMLDLLKKDDNSSYYVAKPNKKTEITTRLIENGVNLSGWHILKDLEDEFKSN